MEIENKSSILISRLRIDIDISMFSYYINMLALESKWDEILSMYTYSSQSRNTIIKMMELCHVYKRDDIIDKILIDHPLSSLHGIRNAHPIIIYTAWRTNHPNRESLLTSLIPFSKYTSEDIIGYITSEMREYLREHVQWGRVHYGVTTLNDYPFNTSIGRYILQPQKCIHLPDGHTIPINRIDDIETKRVILPDCPHLYEYGRMTFDEIICHAYKEGFIDGFDFSDVVVTHEMLEVLHMRIKDESYTPKITDGPIILDKLLESQSPMDRLSTISQLIKMDNKSPSVVFVLNKYRSMI